MQQAPSFLALSIRSAFQASKATSRGALTPLRCIAPKTPRLVQPWARQQLYASRLFHSAPGRQADETQSKKSETAAPSTIELPNPPESSSPSSEPEPTPTSFTTPSSKPTSEVDPLPSHEESRRSQLSKRFTQVMDTLQSNVFVASQHLNDLTGYSGIEALKREIEVQERHVQETRKAVKLARDRYTNAIEVRSSSQREVNDLLQRKHAWSPSDLERFTSLYRSDHANEQAEAKAQEDLSRAEREAEEAAAKLTRTILARYHEEQIWSDKIRRMSTWGTWGLMGLNVFLFLVFQVAVEPWRRKRLVQGFEDKVMEALEKETKLVSTDHPAPATATQPIPSTSITPKSEQTTTTGTAETANILSTNAEDSSTIIATTEAIQEEPFTPLHDITEASTTDSTPAAANTDTIPAPSSPFSSIKSSAIFQYNSLYNNLHSLFSDKQRTISQKDLTTAILEGVAGGAAMAAVVALMFLRSN